MTRRLVARLRLLLSAGAGALLSGACDLALQLPADLDATPGIVCEEQSCACGCGYTLCDPNALVCEKVCDAAIIGELTSERERVGLLAWGDDIIAAGFPDVCRFSQAGTHPPVCGRCEADGPTPEILGVAVAGQTVVVAMPQGFCQLDLTTMAPASPPPLQAPSNVVRAFARDGGGARTAYIQGVKQELPVLVVVADGQPLQEVEVSLPGFAQDIASGLAAGPAGIFWSVKADRCPPAGGDGAGGMCDYSLRPCSDTLIESISTDDRGWLYQLTELGGTPVQRPVPGAPSTIAYIGTDVLFAPDLVGADIGLVLGNDSACSLESSRSPITDFSAFANSGGFDMYYSASGVIFARLAGAAETRPIEGYGSSSRVSEIEVVEDAARGVRWVYFSQLTPQGVVQLKRLAVPIPATMECATTQP